MDLRQMKLKHLKKASRRAKGKFVTLWKTFGILFLVLTLLLAPMCLAVKVVDNAIAAKVGGSFWKLENRDENAVHFKPDDLNAQELALRVAQEGITLLKNENAALPLASGAKISLFGPEQLKTALEEQGFSVSEDSDTAIAVWDGNTDTLRTLSDRRKSGSLKKLIVLLTDGNVAFLKTDTYQVDAILWIGAKGADSALAEILSGKVNPSGSLPKTLAFDTAPADGVYVGYKYFETRYEDKVMNTGNAGAYSYETQVAYPFGYGLSYTTFAYSDFAVTYDAKTDKFEITLTVTNTGAVAGKETVQVYAQVPYGEYDKENGVEKPSVTLVGFGKTQQIAPGATETLTLIVNKGELATFDAKGAKNYIMGAGHYYLTVAADAHSAVNNILTAKGFQANGDAALTHTWEQTYLDVTTYYTANVGKHASGTLSRQDWQGTFTVQTPTQTNQTGRYNPADYPVTGMPTLGADNGLKLRELIGLPYDNVKWLTLLDQLTFEDMVTLLADNYALQMPIESVEAPGAEIRSASEMDLPSADLLAATFHTQLMEEAASAAGNACLAENVAILRGETEAACSEDEFLAEKTVAAQTAGLQKKGVVLTICRNPQSFVQDAIMDGGILAGQWLPREAWELRQYENDPVIVSAMREACHRNLYALANSSAMNGIGEATTVKMSLPWFTLTCWIATAVCFATFVFFAIMWGRGIKKWKKTQEYLDYKTMKNTLKEETAR